MAMPRVQTTTADGRSLPGTASHPLVSVGAVAGIASKNPVGVGKRLPRHPKTPGPSRRMVAESSSGAEWLSLGGGGVLTVRGTLQILLPVRGKPTADGRPSDSTGRFTKKGFSPCRPSRARLRPDASVWGALQEDTGRERQERGAGGRWPTQRAGTRFASPRSVQTSRPIRRR